MNRISIRIWTVVGAALILGLLTIDTVIGSDIRLIGTYVIPVLLVGLTTTPWRTAAIGVLASVATLASGEINHVFLHTDHVLRAMIVFVGSVLAVQTAVLRQRDLRTRRRMRLINSVNQAIDNAEDFDAKLQGFASALVQEFADWCIFDLRRSDGSRERIAISSNPDSQCFESTKACEFVSAAAVSYAQRAHLTGAELFEDPPKELIDALFEITPPKLRAKANVIISPIAVSETTVGEFYLVGIEPAPPWGDAEVAQVASLARSAALGAEAARLIDELTYAQLELSESRDEVTAIVRNIADGVTAQDKDGNIVYANPAAAAMLRMNAPEDVTNSSPGDVRQMFEIRNADGELLPPERLPGRRALAGEENPQELVRYVWRSTGEERWSMVKASAVKDANGTPILAISVMEDLTEHMRSEAAQRFLSTASKALGESLDYEKTLEAVADAAVPSLGDWCLVEILDKHNELTLVALAHSDGENPTAAEAIRELYESRMEAEVGPANVIRTGEAEFYPEITPELLDRATDNPVRRQLVESLGIRSGIAAPITGRGRTIGVFTLISASSRRLYTETDLATALELGRRAGSAIENARLHTDRTRMLRTMQRSLIPPRLPEMPGVDLAAHFRPAEIDPEVGGDFYDVFQMPDGSWALVIGDVCGKGPDAAAVTALARYTIRTAAMRDTEPEGILSTLNGALIEQAEDDRFCTVAFAKLHPGNGSCGLEIVSAGHPLPVKITGDVSQALGTPGTLLGVVPTPDLPRVEAYLDPGDLLMLYTDGLSAGLHPDDTEYAVEITTGLRPKSAQDAVDRIDAAAAQSREGPRRDDIAIVVASKH